MGGRRKTRARIKRRRVIKFVIGNRIKNLRTNSKEQRGKVFLYAYFKNIYLNIKKKFIILFDDLK